MKNLIQFSVLIGYSGQNGRRSYSEGDFQILYTRFHETGGVCVDAECVGSTVVIGTEVDGDGDDDDANGCVERRFWKHRDRAILCVLIRVNETYDICSP